MIVARYIGGPLDGKPAILRGAVRPGWTMSISGRGSRCTYKLERCGSTYVMRAVKEESCQQR